MQFYEAEGFNPGGVADRPDPRDYQWAEIGAASAPFDWSIAYSAIAELQTALGDPSFVLPIKDQNGSGSCGGQAWSYYNEVLEGIFSKTFEERSAKFIYAQTYFPGGGSTGRDNSMIVTKQGCAREAVLPSYDNGQPPSEAFMERPQDITDAIRFDAASSKDLSYANVGANIETLAQAIRENHGVIALIAGSNNGTWGTATPTPPSALDTKWYHWIYLCKTKEENGIKYLGFPNSWGTSVGEQGWQWLSESYVSSSVLAAWTLVYNPTAPVAFTHDFVTDLSFGDNSNEVVTLQKALQIDGEFPSTVPCTGLYGDITRRAVLAFQLKYAVAPTSVLNALAGKHVGALTRAQLNYLFNK